MSENVRERGSNMSIAEWEATSDVRKAIVRRVGLIHWGSLSNDACDSAVRQEAGGVKYRPDKSIGEKCIRIRTGIEGHAAKDRESLARELGSDVVIRVSVSPVGNSGRVIAHVEIEADADKIITSLER